MEYEYSKITIVRMRRPRHQDLNENLQWLGGSLGLFNLRDKDRSCFRIFIELLKHQGEGMTSDELALRSGLSRGTVVHHLNKLIDAGITVPHRGRYVLRVHNLKALIVELQKDLDRWTGDLKEVADEIDRQLGI
ncbi:winged helix-turn-helix transcriptional regulator [Candidatus Woesearchaeota archaeon]|nr:winged helix-turn-helix transcriptional regulator [Candidatus Woesearchaeota archaeon]